MQNGTEWARWLLNKETHLFPMRINTYIFIDGGGVIKELPPEEVKKRNKEKEKR